MDILNVVPDVLNQFAGPKTSLVVSPSTGAAFGGRYLTDS